MIRSKIVAYPGVGGVLLVSASSGLTSFEKASLVDPV